MGRFNLAMVPKGFTLIELLVAISIIGILSAVGFASFSQAQKSSRDTRRMEDMTAIQKALEQYYSLAGVYPNDVLFGGSLSFGTSTLMNLVPVDPKNSASYVYNYSPLAGQTAFCLCAYLEVNAKGNASNLSCNWTSTPKNYYCVANQQ